MIRGILAAAAAMMVCAPAGAAVIYEASGVLPENTADDWVGLPFLNPGQYVLNLHFDRDVQLRPSAGVTGLMLYDVFCTVDGVEFPCGGNEGPLGWAFQKTSERDYVASIELLGGRRVGNRYYHEDRIQQVYIAAYDAAAYSFTVESVPEPMTWAMLLVGFGFAGSALRLRRAQPVARAA